MTAEPSFPEWLEWGKSLDRLSEALAFGPENPLVIDAAIQRFEFCFELGWKCLKRILREREGIEALSPRQALKHAYAMGYLSDETQFLNMLEDRNLTSHTYHEATAKRVFEALPAHLNSLQSLRAKMAELSV